MNTLIEALKHTPWWVYLILYILIQRGIAARRPNVASLWRLALLPAVFAGLDIHSIVTHQAITAAMVPVWLLAILAGAALGHWLVRDIRVRADHARWLIGLEGDNLLLPLVLIIFCAKYAVAYALGTDPALAHQGSFLIVSLLVGGFCTGIFVGRFGTYVAKFWKAPGEPLTAGPIGNPT